MPKGPTAYTRQRLWEAQPFCVYCEANLPFEKSTAEHIKPRAKGGNNPIDNLVIACAPCNAKRACRELTAEERAKIERVKILRRIPDFPRGTEYRIIRPTSQRVRLTTWDILRTIALPILNPIVPPELFRKKLPVVHAADGEVVNLQVVANLHRKIKRKIARKQKKGGGLGCWNYRKTDTCCAAPEVQSAF